MLGTGPSKDNPFSHKSGRKSRPRTVNLKVSLPAGGDGSARRLARKIQESVARTLMREGEDASAVTVEASPQPQAAPAKKEAPRARTPVGGGAWWAF